MSQRSKTKDDARRCAFCDLIIFRGTTCRRGRGCRIIRRAEDIWRDFVRTTAEVIPDPKARLARTLRLDRQINDLYAVAIAELKKVNRLADALKEQEIAARRERERRRKR